jgi:hypothetical protein
LVEFFKNVITSIWGFYNRLQWPTI